eukprot:TRINITY_DN4273_c0_g1_i1.p1 TRINITY_DN4273_c0_g1~~TRINITY_DN4273_c0_g1_i1.p1  ORF type:complete len:347 (-),score=72.20 TRINITY_DN4273_c0_g1_i1:6-1046(-)
MNNKVVIIGSGVVGLSTGIEFLEKYGDKLNITIITNNDLGDTNSSKSGAHWFPSFESNDLRKKMERLTFEKFEQISKNYPKSETGMNRVKANRFYPEKLEKDPWWSNIAYNFKHTAKENLPKEYKDGLEYETYVSSMILYLPWLHNRFLNLGGKIVRREINCLSEVFDVFDSNVVVDCSGLGAIHIKGIEDKEIFPVRGQSILVKAPFVDKLLGNQGLGKTPLPTYIIPLKVDDLVLLGATSQKGDWNRNVDPKDKASIYERCCQIIPELKELPKESFIADKVGLRPERNGGPVVEHFLLRNYLGNKYDIHLIRNNGHGGYGVQSSWGAAQIVLGLYNQYVKKSNL